MKKIVIISGATATGKTGLAIASAQRHPSIEIVNFDSLLFYNELTIGTAKPDEKEQQGIPHHLVGSESAKEPINASRFVELAEPIIDKLHSENKIPLLVGGSAFYLRALIKGMYESESISDEVRTRLQKTYDENGIEWFISYLQTNDSESLENLHENDHYRLIRAVEHHVQTGSRFSAQKKQMDEADPYDFSTRTRHEDWQLFHAYLNLEKEDHWKIMKERAAKMIRDGLIDEVSQLLESGFTGQEKPMQSIGYKETQQFLQGDINSEEELLERISISTRQLAKSQKTFFKKIRPKQQFNVLTETDKYFIELNKFLTT